MTNGNDKLIEALKEAGIFEPVEKVATNEEKFEALLAEANGENIAEVDVDFVADDATEVKPVESDASESVMASEGAEGLCYSVILEKPFVAVEGKENVFKVNAIISESIGAENAYVINPPYEMEFGVFQNTLKEVIGDGNKIISCKLIY